MTDICIGLSHPLTELEYGNKKTQLKEAKKLVSQLEKAANSLGRRIRDEVFEEVMATAKEKNKNYKGDVTRFRTNE